MAARKASTSSSCLGAQARRVDRVLGLVAQLGGQHGEALRRQRAAHQVEIGGIGQEERDALFLARLEVLGARPRWRPVRGRRRPLRARPRSCPRGRNPTPPSRRCPAGPCGTARASRARCGSRCRSGIRPSPARGAAQSLRRSHARNAPTSPVRPAPFLMARSSVSLGMETLRACSTTSRSREFARRIGAAARGDHDVLGQLAEQLAPGIGGRSLPFAFHCAPMFDLP